MVASGTFAGVFTPEFTYACLDREGKRFGDELTRIGYRGADPVGAQARRLVRVAHRAGPILEAEGKVIGVVQGVQGMRWYEVTVTGQDAHTGSTPMHLRKNALQGAARDRAHRPDRAGPRARVGTVGLVEVKQLAQCHSR